MGVELTILNSFRSQRGRGSKDHFLGRGPWTAAPGRFVRQRWAMR
jgi:hypothetical protein